MNKKLLATVAMSALLLTGCTMGPKDTIVKVNGQNITQSEFDKTMEDALGNSMFSQMGIDVKNDKNGFLYLMVKDKAVNELIVKSLLTQEMEKRNIKVSKEDVDKAQKEMIDRIGSKEKFNEILKQNGLTAEKFRKSLEEDVKMRKLVASIASPKVSEADAKSFYKKNLDKFKNPDKVRALHILISANPDEMTAKLMSDKKGLSSDEVKAQVAKQMSAQKAKADKLLAQVKKNPASFEKVARENSDDTMSAKKGGDLGFFARHEMVPEFSKAAFSQRPNTVSALVKTQYGYHIILVKDRMQASQVPFEKTKSEIMAYLDNQNQIKVLDNLVESLKKQAKIEYVNPEYNPEKIQAEIKAASQKKANEAKNAPVAPAAK